MNTRPQADRANLVLGVLRTRWLVRAPIWIYRARLGWLFGQRLLLLEHTGRKSGQPRYVVLEVVDRRLGGYSVVAGFGERAQWLRNVDADPRVRVSVGRRDRVPATARRLPPSEVRRTLQQYARQHPRAWRRLAPVLAETLGATPENCDTTVPMVALELN